MNVYVTLTREFNRGRLRAILSSGQAVVLHQLAIMSKDGDWILREDPECLDHVIGVLSARGAQYRFGAPLDERWLAGGWSAHLEFTGEGTRVRTDFVTRPPRLSTEELASLWQEQEGARLPHVDVRRLIELKKTNREKDYAVIGELARKLVDPEAQLASSRSARDILDLRERHPEVFVRAAVARPVLAAASAGREALEAALDAERRRLMRRNERRLAAYLAAAGPWADRWRALMPSLRGVPLEQAHALVVSAAEGVLPFDVSWDDGDA